MVCDGFLHGFLPAFESAKELEMDFPAIYSNFGILLGHSFAKEHITFRSVPISYVTTMGSAL